MTSTTSHPDPRLRDLLHPAYCQDCHNDGVDLIHRGEPEVFTPAGGDGLLVLTPTRHDELGEHGQVIWPTELVVETAGPGPVTLTAGDAQALTDTMRGMVATYV